MICQNNTCLQFNQAYASNCAHNNDPSLCPVNESGERMKTSEVELLSSQINNGLQRLGAEIEKNFEARIEETLAATREEYKSRLEKTITMEDRWKEQKEMWEKQEAAWKASEKLLEEAVRAIKMFVARN